MNPVTESDLECMLLDEAIEPKALPFDLLAKITNKFSDEMVIGSGGFAIVYKAMLKNGGVAVKRLSSDSYKYDKEFQREIKCLMKVKHGNIVRFLGYCADIQRSVGDYNGEFVLTDVQHRLLCFQYLPKGSLYDYIEDPSGGLEWRQRYTIIKGICEGLCYLHQNNILHLDLKPANILLDENMQPKITDFGMSRFFDKDQTRFDATKVGGTMGYLPPEFTCQVITPKFDLYSLGVVMMEILTGKRGYQDIENVLESWRNRLQISPGSPDWEQIKVCIEIGMQCTDYNPGKRPRSMKDIMVKLAETEVDELGVHPLELCFPFEHNKWTTCLVSLTNNTNELMAFMLIMDGSTEPTSTNSKFLWLPIYGIVPPRSCYTVVVATEPSTTIVDGGNDLILKSTTLAFKDNDTTDEFIRKPDKYFEEVKDAERKAVQEVRLKAVYTSSPAEIITSSSKSISPHIKIMNAGREWDQTSLDTLDSKQWIITGHSNGLVRLWNHRTQKLVSSCKVSLEPGTSHGIIHVYSCETEVRKITSFATSSGIVTELAVHPTQPYLLSADSTYMDLWDWEKDWKCAQKFQKEKYSHILQVVFNQKDTIASASVDGEVQVWCLNSPECRYTFSGHLERVNCLCFFTCYDQEYLVTGSNDQTAKIWDMQENKCVRTLEATMSPVLALLYEPIRDILITASQDGCICLWRITKSRISSSSPWLERIVNIGVGRGAPHSLAYLMGRVVIGRGEVVAIMNIDNNVNNLEESTDGYSETLAAGAYNCTTGSAKHETCKVMSSSSQLLDVALERFPFEPNECISWLVQLTNSTDEHVIFMLMDKTWSYPCKVEPLCGILPPRSSYTSILSTNKDDWWLPRRQSTNFDLVLKSIASGYMSTVLFKDADECRLFLEEAKEMGNKVQELSVLLKADYHAPKFGESIESKPAVSPSAIKIISMKPFFYQTEKSFGRKYYITGNKLCSIDAHPTEKWIITGHDDGYIRTWNHETEEPMDTLKVSERSVTCIKVIARKQWIVAMDCRCSISVYNCAHVTEIQKITSFTDKGYHSRSLFLFVHPTKPYVLSSSRKLWDWDKGWENTQELLTRGYILDASFDPKDPNCFVYAIQIGEYEKVPGRDVHVSNSFDSPNPEYYTMSGHLKDVCCLHFFTRDDRQYLITGSDDCTAKIWDWEKRECIHTMEVMSPVTCVTSLPDRPYLVTGSDHGTVQLWSSINFRLDRTINLCRGGPVVGLLFFMGSPRVVIGQTSGISIIEIGNEGSVSSEGHNK